MSSKYFICLMVFSERVMVDISDKTYRDKLQSIFVHLGSILNGLLQS